MKKIISTTIVLLGISFIMQAQDSTFRYSFKRGDLKIVGLKNIYPAYLADPLGNRCETAAQFMKYADFDFDDNINNGGDYRGHLVIYPSFKMSLLQFRPKSNPKLGIEGEIGIMLPIYLRMGGNDMMAMDGIYYFAIAGNPTEWLYLRWSKHHICTHLGDEFSSGPTISVTDVDPAKLRAPVNDDMRFNIAVKPLWFMGRSDLDILMVYGELGYFDPGTDFLGDRQSKPHTFARMNYMTGAELEYYFTGKLKKAGGVYAAYNVSWYQENSFAPNTNFTMGYILPQDRYNKRMRIGMQFYNGRSLLNQFYYKKERFFGVYLAFDV